MSIESLGFPAPPPTPPPPPPPPLLFARELTNPAIVNMLNWRPYVSQDDAVYIHISLMLILSHFSINRLTITKKKTFQSEKQSNSMKHNSMFKL